MLTMLSGSSKSAERTVIPIPDSKPQELMTFIDRVFHPIASPPDLPKEPRVSKFHPGSKEKVWILLLLLPPKFLVGEEYQGVQNRSPSLGMVF
jgi:hypothetical protein